MATNMEKVGVEPATRQITASSHSRTSTSSTTRSAEDLREEALRTNPKGSTRATGVSVRQAEADFAELQRELSHLSRASYRRSQGDNENGQPENGLPASEGTLEQFDLEAVLRGDLDAEREAGIRPKHIGVYWTGLTVKGMGGQTNYVKTFPDAFVDFFDFITPMRKMLGFGKKGVEATLLDDFKGVCKPGEMILVLGKPGSGCTTFLRTIANQRYGYTGVAGEVLYGPFTAKEFIPYRGEAVYNEEDDVHHPTLTVEQTLGFALDVKSPGKLPAGITKQQFKEKVITTLLKMFNIEHTRKTIVGNPFVRGVSGGERKRVSIAEMLVSNACVLSWDNSTRGLDASTALDFAKSLRIQTDLYKTSTFVSLYQASENIYNLFDKVMVIDEGRQVYFGPASEARAYFEGLGFLPRPRKTTPDYVTGCTDAYEREYQHGRSVKNAPHSPATLEAAFAESKFARDLEEEMAQYKQSLAEDADKYEDFRVAVGEQKRRGASRRSAYSVGFHQQVAALMRRQFLLKKQDVLALVLSWLRNIIIAIVLGTLYLNLGQTSASAFSKGGLLFISLLHNVFSAFSELAGTMTGRAVVNKHRAYAFHRPSALWIAQILVDQIFAATQILVFAVIVYFMTNLARDAGAFFSFYLLLLSANMAMTLFFRILGCISPDFYSAVKFATVGITLMITTAGYLIRKFNNACLVENIVVIDNQLEYQSEKVWLRWIYYINIVGLSFSALMENEFSRSTLTCTAESLIPSGPEYTNIDHQVCTLAGSTAGTLQIPGRDYIEKGFSYGRGLIWRDWGIVVAIIVFFLAMNIVAGEFVRHGMGGNQAKVFKKPNAERKRLNEELIQKREERRKTKGEDSDSSDLNIKSESILTWEDLCYEVPVPGGTRQLLDHVFGYVKPGQLTALMGASGAGKTTLLDVLACRKNIGTNIFEFLSSALLTHTTRSHLG